MNLAELAWPDIAPLAPHTPVVVPVAAMEQHGRHLPLATDSMLLGEVVRRVASRDTGYGFEPAYRGWITRERRPEGADAPGHLGAPRHASAEKGEHLLACFAAGVEAFLHRVVAWDGRSWEFPPDG